MVRKGVLKIEGISPIQLNQTEPQEVKPVVEDNPRIMVDAMEMVGDSGDKILISNAMVIVSAQMKVMGMRKASIDDYNYIMQRFTSTMNLTYVSEITSDVLLEWLSTLTNASDSTKNIRLRVIKAVLNRFMDCGWLSKNWWKQIQIKTDTKLQKPSNEKDLAILLSLLDYSKFTDYRLAVAVLVMLKCGIRMNSLVQLQEKHIDWNNSVMVLTGDITKNHKMLKLPIPSDLLEHLKRLVEHNDKIRKIYHKKNSYIFISKDGNSLGRDGKPTAITKQLSYYAKEFNLKNISPHCIRRCYAMNLRKKNADVLLIKEALGHTSLSTTTKYLNLSTDEVLNSLRDYL